MNWPLSQDYNEAVQNPATCFGDDELRSGEVACSPLGLPIPRSGNFADVYQIAAKDGRRWAVKCFTRRVEGLQERYARIDAHLSAAKLPFTVGFRYLDDGIRIKGHWFPVVKMEWVEGFALNDFVRDNLTRPANLEALFQIWLRLSKRLRESNIAHADLQHGNVLLVPANRAATLGLKLIDYDGMWIPPLAKMPSGEVGHSSYQHPQRAAERLYSQHVDRFPHLVIGTALLSVLIGGPSIWSSFDNGDNLLFREADLREPENSNLVKILWFLGNPTLCHLLGRLTLSCWRPSDKSPWLDHLMANPKTLALTPAEEAEVVQRLNVTPITPGGGRSTTPQVFIDLGRGIVADLMEEDGNDWLYGLIGISAALIGLIALAASLLFVWLS